MIEIIVNLLYTANIAFFLIVGIYILLSWKRSKAHRRFFFVVSFGLFWIINTYFQGVETSWVLYKFITYANFASAALVAAAITGFAIHFPNVNDKISLKKELLIISPLLIVSALSFTNIFVNPVAFREVERVSFYYAYISVLIIYFILVSGGILIRKYFKSQGIERKQLKLIVSGYLITIIVLLIQSMFMNIAGVLPTMTDRLTTTSSFIFSSLTAYAMLRYRFMDVRAMISKGLIYVTSLGIALFVYTLIIIYYRQMIEESWNTSVGWTAVVLILVTVVGFIPVKKGVEYLVNKMFKGRKSIDLAVAELKKDISEQSDAAALAKLVTAQTRRFLDVGEAHVYLGKPGEELVSYGNGGDRITRDNDVVRYFQKYREPVVREEISHMMDEREGEFERDVLLKVEKEMKKQKVSIAMPFVHEDGLYGLLTVGERDTKEAFTVQDIQFLTKLREEIGFTLASALQYSYAMERIRVMQEKGEL